MSHNNSSFKLAYLSDRMAFPDVSQANVDGLLAVGGDLSPERLLLAYQNGIFPWFNEDEGLILWWSPDPRMVLYPNEIKISKSMRKVLRDKTFTLTKNTCFEKVVQLCATVDRHDQEGTWITNNMKQAYITLHERGIAVSYEVWHNNQLVGGLYGIDLGHVFCGESMFSLISNASKFAFIQLALDCVETPNKIIDCQLHTNHLESLGAKEITRETFIQHLNTMI